MGWRGIVVFCVYGWNANSNKYVLRNVLIVATDDFKVIGSSFYSFGAATEKARLPKLRS